jgi:hypothetical protein
MIEPRRMRCSGRLGARSFMDAAIDAGRPGRRIGAGARTSQRAACRRSHRHRAGPLAGSAACGVPRAAPAVRAPGWNGRQEVRDAGRSKLDSVARPTLGVARSERASTVAARAAARSCRPACSTRAAEPTKSWTRRSPAHADLQRICNRYGEAHRGACLDGREALQRPRAFPGTTSPGRVRMPGHSPPKCCPGS